jgi:hypothetical protein
MYDIGICEQLGFSEEEFNDLYNTIVSIRFSVNPIVSHGFDNNKTLSGFHKFSYREVSYYLKATYNTEMFMNSGGCIEYYRNLIEDQKKEI